MKVLETLSFDDVPKGLELAVLRDAVFGQSDFDYCQYQELVTLLGGDEWSPAVTEPPKYPGDNLGYYGLKYWMDHATFSVIDDEWKLPTFSGVYVVTCIYPGPNFLEEDKAGCLHTLYVGCAENIAKRVSHPDHWYQRAQRRFAKKFHVGLYVLPTTDYRLYERSLIRTLRPFFNIHHRNG